MNSVTCTGEYDYIKPGSEEYLNHLGASEASAILCIDGFEDQMDVWKRKTRRCKPQGHKLIFDRGHDMEPIVTRKLGKEHGRVVTREQIQFRDPKRPWLICHVDGLCGASDKYPGTGIVEIKAPGSRNADIMAENGMSSQYTAQVQVGLHVSSAASEDAYQWALCAFLNYDDYKVVPFDVPAAPTYQTTALQILDHFWDCVQRDTPPEPVNPGDLPPIPVISGEKVILETDDAYKAASMFLESSRALSFAKANDGAVREVLKTLCEDNGLVEIPSLLRMSYKYPKPRETVDGKGLLDYCEHLIGLHNGLAPADDCIVFDRHQWVKIGEPKRRFTPTVIQK